MLYPVGNHFDGEPFRIADRLFARRPVRHDPGQFQRLGNPAPVIFPIDLYGKVHPYIVSQSQYQTFASNRKTQRNGSR